MHCSASMSISDHDWIENLRGELDLTLDRRFISEVPTSVPLVRGDQIERFTSSLVSDKPRWAVPAFLHGGGFGAETGASRAGACGRSPVQLSQEAAALIFLTCRAKVGSRQLVQLLVVGRDDQPRTFRRFLLGALNSSILEWRFRLTSSTNHVGNYELNALPLPAPDPGLVHAVDDLVDLCSDSHDAAADAELDQIWLTHTAFPRATASACSVHSRSRHQEVAVHQPLFDHVSPRSELELLMIRGHPPGGNWQHIPTGLSDRRRPDQAPQ